MDEDAVVDAGGIYRLKVRRGCRRSVFLGEGQVERQLHCLSHQGMCPASIYRRPDLYVICILTKFSHHAEAQADQCVCVCVCLCLIA